MAESPSHPDCVHCRFMIRHKHGEYRCRQHNIILHTPVSLFCKMIAMPDDKDEAYQDWFQAGLDVDSLDASTLYTWIETVVKDADGQAWLEVDVAELALITAYVTWSAGTFWTVLRDVRRKKQREYQKQSART